MGGRKAENTPHILGLHVVEQIAAAHGGRAVFEENTPKGARAAFADFVIGSCNEHFLMVK